MIYHLVAFSPDPEKFDELREVMAGLGALVAQIGGFVGFIHGENIDVEAKSPDHRYGFICTFSDRAALDRYASDPRHQALGGRLVDLAIGGADGIIVFDLDDGRPA